MASVALVVVIVVWDFVLRPKMVASRSAKVVALVDEGMVVDLLSCDWSVLDRVEEVLLVVVTVGVVSDEERAVATQLSVVQKLLSSSYKAAKAEMTATPRP